jgi:hypothetical protein
VGAMRRRADHVVRESLGAAAVGLIGIAVWWAALLMLTASP